MAIQDDYLPCKSYQGHDISEERISKFLNEKSKKHYRCRAGWRKPPSRHPNAWQRARNR